MALLGRHAGMIMQALIQTLPHEINKIVSIKLAPRRS